MDDVTFLLHQAVGGDKQAAGELLPRIYDELRRVAAAKMSREAPGHTLGATALVHEAYLRLIGDGPEVTWDSRRHFFAAAAEAMRRILVESARRKRSIRMGGEMSRKPLDDEEIECQRPADEVLALHEALDSLAAEDPVKADVVKLRYFVGMTIPETARVLNISVATANRHWTYARAWLHHHVVKGDT